ncbi:hypothetical protein POJ06DRAFT_241728 [Lipomyces tetrasporus]|uniref:Restriction endonuclease domain-containing protein n=1 Tax=Lipomyces tetrasporus TaxID=54092 RepID=A0AAD7QXS7_9ASCO|nr:uncharacterized protein POJ06DRAFT_241728 [Lipomyces tetrasporus]KAJ8103380.1 hypothetical protein POJ06DRAFT_241728 [Lipomyces tetrasporus]
MVVRSLVSSCRDLYSSIGFDKMRATRSPTPSDGGSCSMIRAYHVSHPSRHEFTNFDNLKDFLEERTSALITRSGPQYVAISNFEEGDLLNLESSGLRRELPGFRVLLDEENKTAIIKLMPGIPHEVATSIFVEMFVGERARLGLPRNIFVPTGSGRYHLSNELSKEPDASYKPQTRKGADRYPSFIVEVGVSQSLLQLRQDARLWLQRTNGDTKVVLLIFLNIAAGTLTFERWQHATSPPPRSTRSRSLYVAEKVQVVIYDKNT